MTALRAYLAGPDVFLRNPIEFAERKKALCASYGFLGVFPLDAELQLEKLDAHDAALAISRANENLIRGCQLVIAHVTPFRGPSADVGTAYEMGFGRALGLPIFAYTNVAEDFTSRTQVFAGGKPRPGGGVEDRDQLLIESFGLTDNLMLVGGVESSGGHQAVHTATEGERYIALAGFEECLLAARELFDRNCGPRGAIDRE